MQTIATIGWPGSRRQNQIGQICLCLYEAAKPNKNSKTENFVPHLSRGRDPSLAATSKCEGW